jgi:hypothetical protein
MESENNHIEADSNIDACRKYLKQIGIDKTPIRSGGNDVSIKVEPFYIENGTKYYYTKKKISWYKLI